VLICAKWWSAAGEVFRAVVEGEFVVLRLDGISISIELDLVNHGLGGTRDDRTIGRTVTSSECCCRAHIIGVRDC
jgi:hypothetical protein